MSAVLLPRGLSGFKASGLEIDMLQPGVSSAVSLDGCTNFELRNNTMRQRGVCPKGGDERVLALNPGLQIFLNVGAVKGF